MIGGGSSEDSDAVGSLSDVPVGYAFAKPATFSSENVLIVKIFSRRAYIYKQLPALGF